MIAFTTGNLLDTNAEALVNTVNTVGVMGKGIALMFKEAYPANFKAYERACKSGDVRIGRVFMTSSGSFIGPKWIINFPTKQHWRGKTQIEWIKDGLSDLRRVVEEHEIKSIAIPPLGCGNGGLDWSLVRQEIIKALSRLNDVEITVYEPTSKYQNITKRSGVENLTPARALVAESVRRYWVLGIVCTVLEVQKLVWFLTRMIEIHQINNDPLKLDFVPDRYGPYADRLRHLLDAMDGSYLHCSKRLADAGPTDTIWFEDSKKDYVANYLNTEGKEYLPVIDATSKLIDGFESPLGMELLATVDWLSSREGRSLNLTEIRAGIVDWKANDASAAERKNRLFDDRLIQLAIDRIVDFG